MILSTSEDVVNFLVTNRWSLILDLYESDLERSKSVSDTMYVRDMVNDCVFMAAGSIATAAVIVNADMKKVLDILENLTTIKAGKIGHLARTILLALCK